uniref:Odorant-binding protein 22 n=1 Tax=Ectropis obliqua TaxID=248899 RepID=A0A1L2BLF3_ECTOB|nr:odorant-binding protein 22 [Ectropis obliqua]
MARFSFVAFLGVAAVINIALAITEDEKNNIRLNALPVLTSCAQELGIKMEDVVAARQAKNLDALNPCYYACFFKKINVIDNDGLFVPAVAKANHQKYVHGADDLARLSASADTCTSVNDQAVTDGANGCDRAKLLARCFIDNHGVGPFSA